MRRFEVIKDQDEKEKRERSRRRNDKRKEDKFPYQPTIWKLFLSVIKLEQDNQQSEAIQILTWPFASSRPKILLRTNRPIYGQVEGLTHRPTDRPIDIQSLFVLQSVENRQRNIRLSLNFCELVTSKG